MSDEPPTSILRPLVEELAERREAAALGGGVEKIAAQHAAEKLTAREREVAAYLLQGLTSKRIGKTLAISHRTVEIYRARLMRKYQASTTADLVHKLTAG